MISRFRVSSSSIPAVRHHDRLCVFAKEGKISGADVAGLHRHGRQGESSTGAGSGKGVTQRRHVPGANIFYQKDENSVENTNGVLHILSDCACASDVSRHLLSINQRQHRTGQPCQKLYRQPTKNVVFRCLMSYGPFMSDD